MRDEDIPTCIDCHFGADRLTLHEESDGWLCTGCRMVRMEDLPDRMDEILRGPPSLPDATGDICGLVRVD